jgi:hypothetical protein
MGELTGVNDVRNCGVAVIGQGAKIKATTRRAAEQFGEQTAEQIAETVKEGRDSGLVQ